MSFLFIVFSMLSHNAHASEAGMIINGYAAKDYCSCRFVVGQTDAHCKSRIGVGFPLPHGHIYVDETKGEVRVEGPKPENIRVAIWTRTRLGCRLLMP